MSWLDRNAACSFPIANWTPENIYQGLTVVDPETVGLFWFKGTRYSDSLCNVSFLSKASDKIVKHESYSLIDDDIFLKDCICASDWIVVFASQRRLYGEKSQVRIDMQRDRWQNLAEHLSIPDVAIEVLHDNNGSFVSFYTEARPSGDSNMHNHARCPGAFHIILRPSNCRSNESFVYARHDYTTNKKTVLYLGTKPDDVLRKTEFLLASTPHLTIFHLLHLILSVSYYVVENHRWEIDEHVQAIDSSMPHSGFGLTNTDNIFDMSVDHMNLMITEEIAWPRNTVQLCHVSATSLERTIVFTEAQLRAYAARDQSLDISDRTSSFGMISQLSNALQLKAIQCQAQILQLEGLRTRVDTYFAIISGLVAQRDSAINLEIARAMQKDAKMSTNLAELNLDLASAMKEDSKLMRGIAFVTMTFLPATTFATFFSMGFFNIDFSTQPSSQRSKMVVSPWIWIYFLCTIPFTVALSWQYGSQKMVKSLLIGAAERMLDREAVKKVVPSESWWWRLIASSNKPDVEKQGPCQPATSQPQVFVAHADEERAVPRQRQTYQPYRPPSSTSHIRGGQATPAANPIDTGQTRFMQEFDNHIGTYPITLPEKATKPYIMLGPNQLQSSTPQELG